MKEIIVKDGSLFIMPSSVKKSEETVNEILSLVKNAQSENVKVNLTGLNMFDALKVAALTSAKALTQNIGIKYEIVVADEITKAQIQLLSLSNLKVNVEKEEKQQIVKQLVVEV